MNRNQTNKIRMFQAANLVLDNFASVFAQSESLVTSHQALKDALGRISQYRQIQETATAGWTIEKEQLREASTVLMLRTSAALTAYATSIQDVNLKKKAHYVPSRLHRSSDPVLYDIGLLLHDLASPLVEQLAVYFIGQAELDELGEKLAAFKAAIPQNRVATGSRKSSTENISELIQATNRLLKNEIDNLMLPFQFIQPDFYEQYRNARIIVDYSGRPRAEEETTDGPSMPA